MITLHAGSDRYQLIFIITLVALGLEAIRLMPGSTLSVYFTGYWIIVPMLASSTLTLPLIYQILTWFAPRSGWVNQAGRLLFCAYCIASVWHIYLALTSEEGLNNHYAVHVTASLLLIFILLYVWFFAPNPDKPLTHR